MSEREGKSKDSDLGEFVEETVQEELAVPTIQVVEQPEFFRVPKRFGTVPVDTLPLGFAKGKGYYDKYPFIRLPFQKIEEIHLGYSEALPKNRLFWGDNLHIMRMLPSESIDLIYIDPPFFSGRQYNVVFGDENEVRSFDDIWDGGMPTYLVWLNARLLEMKRLLKNTGSIYVHLDWHAAHYVKVEMDKIFGYDNFRSEIIWSNETSSGFKAQANKWIRGHDTILYYTKSNDFYFKKQHGPLDERTVRRYDKIDKNGKRYKIYINKDGSKRLVYLDKSKGRPVSTVWTDIPSFQTINNTGELIGYPTQKPETLIGRIIESSSASGSTIADFFVGGGTTAAVAQKLGRNWIASDISRIAVEITKGRLIGIAKNRKYVQRSISGLPNIEILSWGYYDISSLSRLDDDDFKDFVLDAFGARKISDPLISGLKDGIPVYIGPRAHGEPVDDNTVFEFAEYLETNYEMRKRGIMIAWQFSEKARKAQEMLAELGAGIEFVSIDLVPIGSESFKKHITQKSRDYTNFLRFILPPVVRLRVRKTERLAYMFDFSESVSMNSGRIINVQADFDFDGVFSPTVGYAMTGRGFDSGKIILNFKFESRGDRKIAFKIEDDQGGEAIVTRDIKVE